MGPLDQETGPLPHVLGMTPHLGLRATVPACVLEHETASLCLSPCFSPGHHREEATQTPFLPDDLRCPANVEHGGQELCFCLRVVQVWIQNRTSGLKPGRLRFITRESQRSGRAPTTPPRRPILRFLFPGSHLSFCFAAVRWHLR